MGPKGAYYLDVALVRYRGKAVLPADCASLGVREDQQVRFMRESEFINMFQYNRPNDDSWREISCIQTAIRSLTGCGTPVYVHYKAPLATMADTDAIIDYKLHEYSSDYSLLSMKDEQAGYEEYALKQCAKIATHIQRVHGVEVLQMRAEFLKDENGALWFYYCRDLHVRGQPKLEGGEIAHMLSDDEKKKL